MEYKNISKTVYKVSDFLSWQRHKSLELSPSFQRRSVWTPIAKSFLLDTVVRGLPVPIIIIRERTDMDRLEPIREVVDGQQRLRTLFSFIEPSCLADYDPEKDAFTARRTHNKEIARKPFSQLEPETQRVFLNYEFSTHVLPSDTDDREVLEIFSRLNATGVQLKPQEIRNAKFAGEFKTLMYQLAHEQLDRWRSWKIFSESEISRMTEVEETSDLVILMLTGLHQRNQGILNKYYGHNDDKFDDAEETARRFRLIMDKISETLGNTLSSTVFSRKALFNTLFSFYYDLMFQIGSNLSRVRPQPIHRKAARTVKTASDLIRHGDLSDELDKALRGATSDHKSRETRLRFVQEIYRNGQE